MNINDVFPSKYIKASDLNNKAMLLTINSVAQETVGDDTKPVVYFNEVKKGLVLNKTNALIVASRYGPETDGWTSAQIELYPDITSFKGQPTSCLRIRIPVAPAEPPSPEEPTPF